MTGYSIPTALTSWDDDFDRDRFSLLSGVLEASMNHQLADRAAGRLTRQPKGVAWAEAVLDHVPRSFNRGECPRFGRRML